MKNVLLNFQYPTVSAMAVMGDIKWTDWSVFDEIRIKFDSGFSDNVTTTNWKSSFRYSMGASYKPDNKMDFGSFSY